MARWLISVFTVLLLAGCGDSGSSLLPPNAAGKVVFINYWAQWCKPCREEIPELNRFADAYADRVAVYGVNFDAVTGEELERQVSILGIGYPSLNNDPAAALGTPYPETLPVTLVLSGDQKLVSRLVGKQSYEDLVTALDAAEFVMGTKVVPWGCCVLL